MSGYIGTQPVPQSTQTRDSFTATSGQTSFATGGYQSGYIDLYLNGIKLAAADYTATNNSDVVLAVGATAGDILEVVAYTAFNTANVTGAVDFTVTNNIVVGGTVDGVDIAARDAVLTATTTTANAALPLAGGTLTGDLTVSNASSPTIRITDTTNTSILDLRANDSDVLIRATSNHPMIFNTNQTNRMQIAANGDISFYEDTGSTAKLFWDASAEALGIGLTSNISSKLHVNSEVSLGPDNNNRMIVGSTSGGVGSIGTIQGGTASFGTMTFKSGNVGIGCTPEAWNTSHKILRAGTRTSLANTTGGSGESTYLANNYYNNGAAELYLETGAVSLYTQSVGKHNFQVAASGTAGAALTLTTAMTIDNAGIVTTPSQPYFYAHRNGGNYTTSSSGSHKVLADGLLAANGNHYSTSNARFTCPVAGVYQFNGNVNVYFCAIGSVFAVSLRVNGSAYTQGTRLYSGGTADLVATVGAAIKLSAGDYVELWFSTTDGSVGLSSGNEWNVFTGYLVG